MLTAGAALLLTAAPDHARYVPDLLPAFLLLGSGVGLVFPAASVTAMSDVIAEQAGLRSGVLMTSHELGAALGVAVLSAIAATSGGHFAAGYEDGFLAVSVIALVLIAVAFVAVPVVRSAPAGRPALH